MTCNAKCAVQQLASFSLCFRVINIVLKYAQRIHFGVIGSQNEFCSLLSAYRSRKLWRMGRVCAQSSTILKDLLRSWWIAALPRPVVPRSMCYATLPLLCAPGVPFLQTLITNFHRLTNRSIGLYLCLLIYCNIVE